MWCREGWYDEYGDVYGEVCEEEEEDVVCEERRGSGITGNSAERAERRWWSWGVGAAWHNI